MTNTSSPVRHIALIGNYPPRQCGIATFTADLRSALIAADPTLRITTVAMTDPGQTYAYPSDVDYEIEQDHRDAYRAAADHLNALNPDVVLLQHEFGIFGGASGDYLLELTERLRAPLVTTLHTVLTDPNPDERRVMDALASHSARLVVMAEKGRALLTEHWHIPAARIAVIPHGIPDLPFLDPAFQKHRFGLDGRQVILTFGLLSPNKGLEHMIAALPDLVRDHPDLSYVILGATHPHLLAAEGEAYRDRLTAQAKAAGIWEHLRFVNQYVDTPTLQAWLSAADIYVTPYLHEAQITSGTLAYAVGRGKAVVSTPYWHATELLAQDTGVLVPFADSRALAESIGALLDDPARRDQMRARAYEAGRHMIWPEVARGYLGLLGEARGVRRPTTAVHSLRSGMNIPNVSTLRAVDRMVDGCGMLQHSRASVPHRQHGYCLDDNARALMLAVDMKAEGIEIERANRIIDTCAAFVEDAWNEETSVFRNFMDYRRNWLETQGSEDSHGRALWALGRVVADSDDQGVKLWATGLTERVIPASQSLSALRARAFALLGLISWLSVYPGHRVAQTMVNLFTTELHTRLKAERRTDWNWFEPTLAYDNARLPEALISAGRLLEREDMIQDGVEALNWLAEAQTGANGVFRSVGTESFGRPHERPRPFDQQPLEAWAMISACATAHEVTGHPVWLTRAKAAFDWYLGLNDLGLRMATSNGGCFDGLEVDRVNLNQGAESILAFQFAALEIQRLKRLPKIQPVKPTVVRG